MTIRRERLSSKSGVETWVFPGWGTYDMQLSVSAATLRSIAAEMHQRERPKLKEWEATAICANDILSSCLCVWFEAYLVAGPSQSNRVEIHE